MTFTSFESSVFLANFGSKNRISCSSRTPGSPGLLLLSFDLGSFAAESPERTWLYRSLSVAAIGACR